MEAISQISSLVKEYIMPETVRPAGQHGLNARSSITAALQQKNHPPAAPLSK